MDSIAPLVADEAMSPARCPITHEPAVRLIQTVPVKLLKRIWKYIGITDVSELFTGIDQIELWESPCGLAFFSPAVAGDDAFYKSFYGRFKAHEKLAEISAERPEFIAAARHVCEGSRLLDVGSGYAGFRQHVKQAMFTGLDPYAETEEPQSGVLREQADDHAASHADYYDVVSAFQVMEHTVDPVGFAMTLTRMLKPGGTLILGVPVWSSPMIQCPNMLINCPPHHLTWWNERSLQALADRLRIEVVEIPRLPPHRHHAWFHWMEKLTWVDMRDLYYADRLGWHLNVALALPLSLLCDRFLGLPKNAAPIDIMLVARKPSLPN